MNYETVKEYLSSIGAELLTEDQFAERWRPIMGDEPYIHPYGCLNCGKANGQDDFTDVLFAIYPDKLPDHRDKEMNWQTLGFGGPDGLNFTSIARCKFCGQCDIFPDF
ncbi:unnamed protein product [marine sediment metagenome]|uniref:Uncharacterized protein n=1 Tax=marine sediment metagenome TaxID=412755 RepID=X1RQR9_9ZZZZ